MQSKKLFPIALAISLLSLSVRAEEGGSGHYTPGATASFVDALPGREAFAYVNEFTYYNGSAGGSRQLGYGQNIAINVQGIVCADTSILLYQTPWKLLGGQYAAAMAIPYVWMEVKGDVQLGSHTGRRRETANGIGDIEILPVMFGWTKGDCKLGATLGIYAPTGEHDQRLANVGKNYWTFEPGVNLSWLSSKIGTEVSLFTGFDCNTKDDLTDYQSGSVFHLDTTVAQHLPVCGGIGGLGATAFFYQQMTGDSGRGAKLGDFAGRTVGVGPVISYTRKMGKTDIVAEVKWLPELSTEHRLSGNTIWVKLALAL